MTLAFTITKKSITIKCREKGKKNQKSKCNVKLPDNSTVYCAEVLQDEVMGKHAPTKPPICDCIVRDSDGRMSLVELKGGRPRGNILGQFAGGVDMLRHVVGHAGPFYLQAVLFIGRDFTDRSEEVVLRAPLTGVTQRVTISKKKCGDALPNDYVSNCRIV